MVNNVRDFLKKDGFVRLEISEEEFNELKRLGGCIAIGQRVYECRLLELTAKNGSPEFFHVSCSWGMTFRNGNVISQYGMWVPKEALKKIQHKSVPQNRIARLLQEHLR